MFELLNHDLTRFEEQRRRDDMVRVIHAARAARRASAAAALTPVRVSTLPAAAASPAHDQGRDCEESTAAA